MGWFQSSRVESNPSCEIFCFLAKVWQIDIPYDGHASPVMEEMDILDIIASCSWGMLMSDIRQGEGRVAKCQFFYTEQTFNPNFTPWKAPKLQQFWHFIEQKEFENRYWYVYQIRLVQTKQFYITYANLPKKGLIWQNFVLFQTFCPNLQIFLHRIYPLYP